MKTDYWAQSSLNRLYAVGEVASLGIHGANRLASNSLLDGLVYGYRAASHIIESGYQFVHFKKENLYKVDQDISLSPYLNMRHQLRHMMWLYVGILRHNHSLTKTVSYFDSLLDELDFSNFHPIITESKNMLVLAQLMTKSALFREESRGAHFRSDFPENNNAIKENHTVLNKNKKMTYSSSVPNTSFLFSTK